MAGVVQFNKKQRDSFTHIPSRLEPASVLRSDGKWPDGISVVPWQRGKLLVWDTTCLDTFAPSYVASAASGAFFHSHSVSLPEVTQIGHYNIIYFLSNILGGLKFPTPHPQAHLSAALFISTTD